MDPITAFLVNLLISVVLSVGQSLLAQATAKDAQAGVRGTITTGGAEPLSFIVGRYGTAGHLEYLGTWGKAGKTPNAYFTKVMSFSDLPCTGLAGVFVNGERCTILWGEEDEQGFPIAEFREGGKDYLWVRFNDGTQSVADDMLLAKFGTDIERPWLADMIGRGICYGYWTALVNREMHPGEPEVLWEIDGVSLYDRREDDTAFSDNPIVAAEGVLRGFYYDDQWVFGLQGLPEARLPAMLEAQMDKCDALVAKAGGGTEKKYRIGAEIRCDQQPHEVLNEFLKSCNGRIAEIGGAYKMLVDGPGAPVKAITDEDFVITEGQTFDPFPGLEATTNGIVIDYPEPDEAYETKEAPPRYSSDLEVEDDNRRLVKGISLPYVPFPRQVQRVGRAVIEEERRFRTVTGTMPPEMWEYEPLDGIAYSSARNGFDDKLFLITAMDDLPNANQVVAIKELDPADYDWESDYELPWDVFPLVTVRPVPQEVQGFHVEPAIIYDTVGSARRPAIDVFWNGDQDDVQAVRITVQLAATHALVWEGQAPRIITGSARVSQGLLPATAYEVQIEFVSVNRRTVSSSWLPVTTPDVGLDWADINLSIRENMAWLSTSIKQHRDDLQTIAVRLQDAGWGTADTFQQLRTSVSVAYADLDTKLRADYENLITTAVGIIDGDIQAVSSRVESLSVSYTDLSGAVDGLAGDVGELDAAVTATASGLDAIEVTVGGHGSTLTAHGLAITALETSVGDVSAGGKFLMEVESSPGGGWSRVGARAFASLGGTIAEAAWFLDAKTDGTSRFVIVANQTVISTSGGVVAALFDGDTTYLEAARIRNLTATNITAKSIDADDILINGSTITRLIANNAVSNQDAEYTAASINFPSSTDVEFQTITTAVAANVGTVLIQGSIALESDALSQFQLVLKKNGASVTTIPFRQPPDGPSSGVPCRVFYGVQAVDESPGGSDVWTLVGDGVTAGSTRTAYNRFLSYSALKK